MKVLVVNAGSSSLKYQLFETETASVLAKGNCERIGIAGSRIIHKAEGKEEFVKETELADHSAAIQLVVESLLDPEHGCISSPKEIEAIGHRVVAEIRRAVKRVQINAHLGHRFVQCVQDRHNAFGIRRFKRERTQHLLGGKII